MPSKDPSGDVEKLFASIFKATAEAKRFMLENAKAREFACKSSWEQANKVIRLQEEVRELRHKNACLAGSMHFIDEVAKLEDKSKLKTPPIQAPPELQPQSGLGVQMIHEQRELEHATRECELRDRRIDVLMKDVVFLREQISKVAEENRDLERRYSKLFNERDEALGKLFAEERLRVEAQAANNKMSASCSEMEKRLGTLRELLVVSENQCRDLLKSQEKAKELSALCDLQAARLAAADIQARKAEEERDLARRSLASLEKKSKEDFDSLSELFKENERKLLHEKWSLIHERDRFRDRARTITERMMRHNSMPVSGCKDCAYTILLERGMACASCACVGCS